MKNQNRNISRFGAESLEGLQLSTADVVQTRVDKARQMPLAITAALSNLAKSACSMRTILNKSNSRVLVAILIFALVAVMFPPAIANAGERLLNIAVHVKGDGKKNNVGGPLLGASVTLKNTRTGAVSRAVTNSRGSCLFKSVPVGPFEITAIYEGVSGRTTTQPTVSNVYLSLPVRK